MSVIIKNRWVYFNYNNNVLLTMDATRFVIAFPANSVLHWNHFMFIGLYLTSFYVKHRPCIICTSVFVFAVILLWWNSCLTETCNLWSHHSVIVYVLQFSICMCRYVSFHWHFCSIIFLYLAVALVEIVLKTSSDMKYCYCLLISCKFYFFMVSRMNTWNTTKCKETGKKELKIDKSDVRLSTRVTNKSFVAINSRYLRLKGFPRRWCIRSQKFSSSISFPRCVVLTWVGRYSKIIKAIKHQRNRDQIQKASTSYTVS